MRRTFTRIGAAAIVSSTQVPNVVACIKSRRVSSDRRTKATVLLSDVRSESRYLFRGACSRAAPSSSAYTEGDPDWIRVYVTYVLRPRLRQNGIQLVLRNKRHIVHASITTGATTEWAYADRISVSTCGGPAASLHGVPASQPPSTYIAWPVMNEPAREASKSKQPTSSSG